MSFRVVPKSVTLNDLERCNGRYFALFHRIRYSFRGNTILSATEMYHLWRFGEIIENECVERHLLD